MGAYVRRRKDYNSGVQAQTIQTLNRVMLFIMLSTASVVDPVYRIILRYYTCILNNTFPRTILSLFYRSRPSCSVCCNVYYVTLLL